MAYREKKGNLNADTFGTPAEEWDVDERELSARHRDLLQRPNQLPSFFQTSENENDQLLGSLEDEEGSLSATEPKLPEFFQGQESESFLEEPLEDEEHDSRNDFFLEHENEAISQLETQMETIFKDVLEEDEGLQLAREQASQPAVHSPWNSPAREVTSQITPPHGSFWASPSIQRDEIASPQRSPFGGATSKQSATENPLERFFPEQRAATGATIVGPPKGALSVEELEARFTRPPSNYENPPLSSSPSASSPISEPYSPQQPRSPRTQSYYGTRTRWKESKQRMSAAEIDSIIRTQEAQIYSGNPFADDYYFENYRSEKNGVKVLHKPLFESFSSRYMSTPPVKKPDPFEGVLGRIPSHSVRAPRPLLQLKSDSETIPTSASDNSVSLSSRATYSLLLTLENSFNYLLDIEDLQDLLERPESSNHFNLNYFYQKREHLTNDLFLSLHIYSPPLGTLPPRKVSPEQPCVFQQDYTFVQYLFVRKGRELLARAMPLLLQNHLVMLFFAFMRNLALIVTSPKLDAEHPSTKKIFSIILSVALALPVPQTIIALQTIIAAHTSGYLLQICQSKYGLAILQTLLKHAYDLNLSPFSREETQLPVSLQPLMQFGVHWKETINALFQMLDQRFKVLVDLIQNASIWEFLAVLVVNFNVHQKRQMLQDLRPFFGPQYSMNPTISAFFRLCQ